MALEEYKRKRNFSKTSEPAGQKGSGTTHRFVIQEHHATRLHFDFRLEMGGVLKSWAVPKGPSKSTKEKRLAVMTEDHPIQYLDYEGHIPEGNYGAGDMAVWDQGTYEMREGIEPEAGVAKGELKLLLHGEKLEGNWELIHTGGRRGQDEKNWLLIKGRDEFVDDEWTLEQELEGGSNKDRQEILAHKKPSAGQAASNGRQKATTEPKSTGDDGAKAAKSDPMPRDIAPMLAITVDKPFTDPDWLFEIKWDGYRAVCYIENGKARLISRNNLDYTGRFKALDDLAKYVGASTAVLDGEIVALDDEGLPQFQMLQNAAGIRSTKPAREQNPTIVYQVFDLLYADGEDLRARPLTERKKRLQGIVYGGGAIRYADHVVGEGEAFYKAVESRGLEGLVAKKASSAYVGRRDLSWLKIKIVQQQDVVIGGYTAPRGNRSAFGALITGVYDGDKLMHVGQVGGGFDEKLLKSIFAQLKPLETKTCPFAVKPKPLQPAVWVEPKLCCEVKISGWTDDDQLRHPIFLGMRDDKDPRDCVRETPKSTKAEVKIAEDEGEASGEPEPAPKKARKTSAKQEPKLPDALLDGGPKTTTITLDGGDVGLTNLDKIYWPDEGYAKRDLVAYYVSVAEAMLPHLDDRPLILQRYPNGWKGMMFYQHDMNNPPGFVRTFEVEESGKSVCYAIAENTAALAYLANLGVIPIHAWNARSSELEKPDWVVFDLDPDETAWPDVCRVAVMAREVLSHFGLRSYIKSSGSEGLHVYVPCEAELTFHDVLFNFANKVAALVVEAIPDLVTTERLKRNRGHGRVYFDCYQNSPGKSVVAPYSVRPKPGATISTPLEWREVEKAIDPHQFTIRTVPERIAKKGDLFAPVLKEKQSLTDAIRRLNSK